jgi:hypothetical protein
MDKQKQIEEMAKVLCKDTSNKGNCEECGFRKNKKIFVNRICYKFDGAIDLYNAGYRKIPEGALVLTKEEYDELKSLAKGHCEYCYLMDLPDFETERLVRDTTRKETAEKFAKLVEFHSVSTRDEEGREIFTISALGLKEILHEEFGIPYDEIAKGITGGKV